MGTGRSTETSRELAEERVVRTFLERAASLILESRTLDGERFEAVVALAQEVGLTREQLSCELRFLELRGVITSAPWARLDQLEAAARDRGGVAAAALLAPAAPELLTRFREVVQQRLARSGTLTAKVRQAIEADGAAIGLTPTQIAATLAAILAREAPTDAAAAPAEPAPSPTESYRRWVKQKLAGYPSVVLGADDEQGLIGVGTHRYHLAEILALDVVRDVALQRDMRLERDLDGASCHSTIGGSAPASSEESSEPALPAFNAADPRQVERRESFRSYLRRTLAQLPNGVVTFKTHHRLMEAGALFHGVAPQLIKPTIHEVAGEMGSRFISQEQATQHISNLVAELVDVQPFIDAAARARVYAEGTSWGLDPMDIEPILRARIEQNVRYAAAERRQRLRLIALASMIVTLVAAVWLFLFLLRPPAAFQPTLHDGGGDVAAIETSRPPMESPKMTPWWDEELLAAQTKVGAAYPDLVAALRKVPVADEAGRAEAYSQVIAWCMRPTDKPDAHADIQSLLARCYAREPSDVAARQIPQRLLTLAHQLDEDLPRDSSVAEAAFWGCRAAAHLWKNPDIPAQRSAELAALLETVIREPLDHDLTAAQLENQCVAALVRRYYTILPYAAAHDGAQARQLYRVVTAQTAGRVDQTTLDRLDADFLVAALPAIGSRWTDYRDVLEHSVLSTDVVVVQKLLDIWTHTQDASLRRELAAQFSQRLGKPADAMKEADLIEVVRRAVQLSTHESNAQRWERLAGEADRALSAPEDANAPPETRLQHVVDCTYFATLACALGGGEDAAATVEELTSQGPMYHALSDRPPSTAPAQPLVATYPLSAAMVIQQHTNSLLDADDAEDRIALLRLIANATDSLEDIDPASGQKLAGYLWQPKGKDEHRQLLPYVARLARWNSVRLGLADRLSEATEDEAQARDVIRSACGADVSLATAEDRQRVARDALSAVLASLSDSADAGDAQARTIEQGSRAMRELYAVQARLLEVPAEKYASAPSASAVLQTTILCVAGRLDTAQMSAAEQQWLAALPSHITAAEYAAGNDLQYLAMLERMWLKVLGLHVAQRAPAQAAAARDLVASTLARQASHHDVLAQLRDLEAGLLRLWMLCHPEGDAALPGTRDV
jgi:hypothetical protein